MLCDGFIAKGAFNGYINLKFTIVFVKTNIDKLIFNLDANFSKNDEAGREYLLSQ